MYKTIVKCMELQTNINGEQNKPNEADKKLDILQKLKKTNTQIHPKV
jgi:hypothetical protein